MPGRVVAGVYVPPNVAPAGGVSIADVQIDDTYVHTPIGDMRRDQTRWTIGQTAPGPTQIPQWAVLCAVFLFLCMGPFSLLFLLAKENVGETTSVQLDDGVISYVMKVHHDQGGYAYILKVAEWSQRALPARRAIGPSSPAPGWP